MKHYEELWEDGERLTDKLEQDLPSSISGAIAHLEMLKNCPSNMYDYHTGMLILNICSISRILNVNTYSALLKMITDKKAEMLEP
ncbi:MAG TPA: hypothetical protein VM577_13230 [Anaerovoracaceae bacterium]|nr:hypothetical protein [Anaerovoracaceae bacterium]